MKEFTGLRLLCSAVLALLVCGAAPAQPVREFSISTFSNAEPLTRPMERVMVKAYERLGIKATIVRKPIARSLLDADEGLHDAELGRVIPNEKEVKHLIRLTQPLGEIRYTPYTLRSTVVGFRDWDALRQSGLHIGTRFGIRVPEARLGDALKERAQSQESLVKMLVAGHIDVAIATQTTMRATLAKMRAGRVAGVDEVVELAALEQTSLYHFVHERHADLVKPLNAVLKKMQSDGSIQKIWDDAAKEEL